MENRIAFFRRENGMNQKELGAALGVAQTTISAWETGRNEPDSVSLNRMANLFHTSIGYLMGFEQESYLHGLTRAQYEELKNQRDLQRMLRRENAQDHEDEAIEEYLRQEDKARWERSGRPDTLEGFLVSEMIDKLPAGLRQEALNVMYSLNRMANAKPE